MKNIFTLLLLSGVFYLSSCGNGANDPIPYVPPADTIKNGSYFSAWFLNDQFFIWDLKVNNVPVYNLHSSVIYNSTDSLWECRVFCTDFTKKQMDISFMAVGTSPTGTYTVVDNKSTLTDYSHGENKTYSIGIGSVVTLSQSSYPVKGLMNLTLNYNHNTVYANDTFKINN